MISRQYEQDQFLKSSSQGKKNEDDTKKKVHRFRNLMQEALNKKWCLLVLFLILFLCSSYIYMSQTAKKQLEFVNKAKQIAIKIKAAQNRQKLHSSASQFNLIQQNKKTNRLQLQKEQLFHVPNYLWIIQNDETNSSFIIERAQRNIQYYAQKSKFELKIITPNNYSQFLPTIQKTILQNQIKSLDKINDFSLKKQIKEILIKLTLIIYYGGVVMDNSYILTERLDWLQKIKANIHINTGNQYTVPKSFAFFSIMDGPPPKKQNINTLFQSDKNIVKFPALKKIFWAALSKSDFFTNLLQQYYEIIQNLHNINYYVAEANMESNLLNLEQSQTLLYLASVLVLQKKQRSLNLIGEKYLGIYQKLAIDEYGLITMNADYFPDKMHFYFNNRLHYYDNFFNYVAKMPQEQFEDSIGPMRYLAGIDPFGQFNSRLLAATKNPGIYEIWFHSFFQQNLFWQGNQTFLKNISQYEHQTKKNQKWDNLLKNIWLYWDTGFENAPVITQLCVLNLKKNAQAAGYNIEEVNDNNIQESLSKDIINKIHQTIKNAKMQISEQTKSDFVRLALLSTYGGVYLDSSYFFLEDFSWITNIAKEPSKYIFNRFGEVPKVFMQFHPLEGGLFDWKMHQNIDTKLQWHLAVESNFIAANPDSQLIKQWFQMMIKFATSTYDQTVEKMVECGVDKYKWITQSDRYLTVMDSLKTVLGCRQKDIEKNPIKYPNIFHANDYYKLWAFNGFTGVQKFRHYNNYANPHRKKMPNPYNYLLFQHSEDYVRAVYGPIYKAIKIYSIKNSILKEFVARNWKTKFVNQAHPQSIFMKYLYDPSYQYFQTDQIHVRQQK